MHISGRELITYSEHVAEEFLNFTKTYFHATRLAFKNKALFQNLKFFVPIAN